MLGHWVEELWLACVDFLDSSGLAVLGRVAVGRIGPGSFEMYGYLRRS